MTRETEIYVAVNSQDSAAWCGFSSSKDMSQSYFPIRACVARVDLMVRGVLQLSECR